MVVYREFFPTKSLAKFVYCYWYFEDPKPVGTETIVPDARPEFVIHMGSPFIELKNERQQSRAFFAGQLTEPLMLRPTGPVSFWGVRFRPDGSRLFLGDSVFEATNKRIDLFGAKDRGVAELWGRLDSLPKRTDGVQLIEEYLKLWIGRGDYDPVVRAAVDDVLEDHAAVIEHALTDRQFQRRFKKEVGVSLRTFRRIRRFRSVFDRMRRFENETWVSRALEAGYFDQPQLVRDFNQFLGISPTEWIEQQDGLGKALGNSKG